MQVQQTRAKILLRYCQNNIVRNNIHPDMCNSIILNRPLAHTRARTRDLLRTTTTVTLEASLPIAPQKATALAEQGETLLQGLLYLPHLICSHRI